MPQQRNEAYQKYADEITTGGVSRMTNIRQVLAFSEMYQDHIEAQVQLAFQAGWHAALDAVRAQDNAWHHLHHQPRHSHAEPEGSDEMTEAPERIWTPKNGQSIIPGGVQRWPSDVQYIRADHFCCLIAAAYVDAANLHQSLWRETSAYKTDQILKRTPNEARTALDALLKAERENVLREAALAEIGGGPDWEGFGRDLLECWPVGDVDGADLFDAALRNGLIREVPGGYDPEQHTDAECICPEKGDPWYEYAFGAAIEPAPQEPEKYTIGDLTMNRVFRAAGLTNVSDMQAVFDQVEVALRHAIEPAPVSVREAARVLLGHTPKITAKPLAEMSEAMKIDAHPAILLRGFCAALRAIAEGKDDE